MSHILGEWGLQRDEHGGQQGDGGGDVLPYRQLFLADGADDGGADHDAARDQGVLYRGGEAVFTRQGDEEEQVAQTVEYTVARDEDGMALNGKRYSMKMALPLRPNV